MIVLKIIFLFNLSKTIFSLNNNVFNNNNNQNSLQIIQNTPVENNIPLIIQELDKNTFINNKPILTPNVLNNPKELITNTEIKINTTNMDPMCTKECCMGCQVQFNKLVSQKNCIINICKCQIISINNIKINNTNTSNNLLEKEKVIILIGSMNNNIENENENLNLDEDSSYFY